MDARSTRQRLLARPVQLRVEREPALRRSRATWCSTSGGCSGRHALTSARRGRRRRVGSKRSSSIPPASRSCESTWPSTPSWPRASSLKRPSSWHQTRRTPSVVVHPGRRDDRAARAAATALPAETITLDDYVAAAPDSARIDFVQLTWRERVPGPARRPQPGARQHPGLPSPRYHGDENLVGFRNRWRRGPAYRVASSSSLSSPLERASRSGFAGRRAPGRPLGRSRTYAGRSRSQLKLS